MSNSTLPQWPQSRINELETKLIPEARSLLERTPRKDPCYVGYETDLHELELEYKERTGRPYEEKRI